MITSTIVGLMFLGILGIALVLVFLFFREIKNYPQKLSLPTKVSRKTSTNAHAISPKLQKQLHRLLNGDKQAATRLLKHLKQKHPNYPEEWYWEKAILDLERDRH